MVRRITRDDLLKRMLSKEAFKLVDVLSADSYAKEHIKGAISIPVDEIEKKAPGVLKNDDRIIVYCASFDCQASTHAAQKLVDLGYTHVWDYKGGLKDYKEAGLPLEGSLHEADACCGSLASGCCCG